MKEGFVEVRETAEEPVIAKTARVIEEVVVGKEPTTRIETVNDTVRGKNVEAERVAEDAPRCARTLRKKRLNNSPNLRMSAFLRPHQSSGFHRPLRALRSQPEGQDQCRFGRNSVLA
jgi:hypothetical protein